MPSFLHEALVLLLANRAGYRWLAEYFGKLAERDWHTSNEIGADPDDHQHLWLNASPFNPKVSDRMELRLGVLTSENRRAVKKKYNIRAAKRGCLTEQYPKDIEAAKRELRTKAPHGNAVP
jgi:hypothetical protein